MGVLLTVLPHWAGDSKLKASQIPTVGVVNTFNTRSGTVNPENGDYSASQVTNVPNGDVLSINAQDAIDEIDSKKIAKTVLSAKGSLIGATAAGTPVDIPAGADGEILVYDSSQPSGFSTSLGSNDVVFNATLDATVDTTLVDDPASFSIRYLAASRQFQFKPNVAMPWADIAINHSLDTTIQTETDDIAMTVGTWYYFSIAGTQNQNFDMQNYGVMISAHVCRETLVAGVSSYFLQAGCGDDTVIWARLIKLETQ